VSASEDRQTAQALLSALEDNPFYIGLARCVTPRAEAKEAMLSYLIYSLEEARRYGHVGRLDEAGLVASIWSLPVTASQATQKAEEKRAFLRDGLGESALAFYGSISASMAERTGAVVQDTDWYLSILGVSPCHQGQGIGGRLLDPVLQLADAAGVASFLETFSERNRAFYRRLGYETVGTFAEPVTGESYAVMRRTPPQ